MSARVGRDRPTMPGPALLVCEKSPVWFRGYIARSCAFASFEPLPARPSSFAPPRQHPSGCQAGWDGESLRRRRSTSPPAQARARHGLRVHWRVARPTREWGYRPTPRDARARGRRSDSLPEEHDAQRGDPCHWPPPRPPLRCPRETLERMKDAGLDRGSEKPTRQHRR